MDVISIGYIKQLSDVCFVWLYEALVVIASGTSAISVDLNGFPSVMEGTLLQNIVPLFFIGLLAIASLFQGRSVIQQRLSALGRDPRLIKAAEDIIGLGSCAVSKPVRAGFTTSAVIACERMGLCCAVIAPTRKILKETVMGASGQAIRIPSNSECLLIMDMINKTPLLAKLPVPLPDCEQCKKRFDDRGIDRCQVHAILAADSFSVAALTYQKLQALMLSEGKTAQDIRAKLRAADVVLMDEAHELALPQTAHVSMDVVLNIPALSYLYLDRVYVRWMHFCRENAGVAQDLQQKAAQDYVNQHLAKEQQNNLSLDWRDLKKIWKELANAAIDGKMKEDDILVIRDIIHILSAPWVNFSYISEDEGCKGRIVVSAQQTRFLRSIEEFLKEVVPRANHIYGSATLFEPYDGFFTELSGKEVKRAVFPDIRGTAAKMVLVADRWRLSSRNFNDKLPDIIEMVKAIVEHEKQPIYLLAPNGRKAELLREKLKDVPDLFIDYYRSDKTIGVERNERVCISIGMAETPVNSCDPLARGRTTEDRWLDSRRLRLQGVQAATWQAINRVRDPKGEEESHVYFLGSRLDQVRKVATWGTNRRLLLKEIKEHKSSAMIRVPVFDVQVDDPVTVPRIYADEAINDHPERRKAGDYIKSIGNSLKDDLLMTQIPYYIYRGNGSEVGESSDCSRSLLKDPWEGISRGIYNYPRNEVEMASTCSVLFSLFCHRTDCFAVQYRNAKTDRWEYTKIPHVLCPEDLMVHVAGHYSLGAYQLATDDTVIWICYDIDNHDGTVDAKSGVKKLVAVLRQYSIPFLLEASGSPDSYHVWIFLAKTRTLNAFKFSRQIQAEAGIRCEIFPKQKSMTDKSQFGNLVKIPVCINKKSGARSAFLHPDSFEPMDGPIRPPGVVHLYELPQTSELSMPRVSRRSQVHYHSDYPGAPDWLKQMEIDAATTMNYCIQKVLDERIPLQGSEGHEMRVAIASCAYRSGYSIDQAVELFREQPDFDPEETRRNLEYVYRRKYNRYGCEKLQDKCGSLVKPYCPSCPFAVGRPHDQPSVVKEMNK